MNNLIIPDPESLENLKQDFKEQGLEKIHILADFDRTLTPSQTSKGEKITSIIAVLRENNYISEEYSQKAKELFNKYHPMEIDTTLPFTEKKEAMQEWWSTHFKLLIKSGLNKKNLKKIVESDELILRDKAKELFNYTESHGIPIVIISASGLGETISMILKKEKAFSKNINIITNLMKWDENGDAIKPVEPIIHTLNKDETVVQDFPEIYEKIKDRKNIILLGDKIEDVEMATGFDYDNIIKIGFLNPGEEQNEAEYKKTFDIIITNDSGLEEVNKLLKELKC